MTTLRHEHGAFIPARQLGPLSKPSEVIGEGLLWLLMAFVPWPFGSVQAWSEGVVALLAAGLGLCLIKRILFERRRFIWTWAYLPLLGIAGVAWLTTIPLPPGWISWLAPRSAELRQSLLAHLPPGAGGSTTLAFYPFATLRMLRLLACWGIVFVAVIHFCRTSAQVTRLLGVLALVGGLVAVEALLQDATSSGKIYWSIAAPVKSTSGPFVNYNNFCQFMNLTMAAGLGLLLRTTWRGAGEAKKSRVRQREPDSGRRMLLLAAMLLLAGLSVLLSTSRGGVLSMLAGATVVGLALVLLRGGGATLRVAALVGLGILFLLLTWGLESFVGRMSTLSDLESASGARWQVFQDVWAMVPQFWVWGIGLGNHELVYPMFSHLGTWRNAQFVENEYLQLIEEMGVPGVALAAAFASLIAWNLLAILRRSRSGLKYAAVGLAYGLVAVAVGSVTDFGQRLASVGCVTAIVCGLIVAIRKLEAGTPAESPREAAPAARWRRPAFSAALLALLAWMVLGATNAAAAEDHWQNVVALEKTLVQKGWKGSDDDYDRLIAEARAALEWEPGNVERRCWLNIYRWHAGIRDHTWNAMSAAERTRLFDDLIREFERGEVACPTYGLNYAMAGQIRYLGLQDPAGAAEIRRARELAPTHPAVCFIAGRMAAVEGQWDEARADFQRAMELHYPRQEVLAVYVSEVKRPDLAVEVFADRWDILAQLAQIIGEDPAQAGLSDEVRLKSQAVLTGEAQKPGAPVQTLAAMADLMLRQGDLPGSIAYYRRAIDGNYGNVDWHLGLARALEQAGEKAQALQEASICLGLKPDSAAAQQLLSDLATPRTPAPDATP